MTETDKAVEDMISSSLREKYPAYEFMGEETYKPGDRLTEEPTFIVDPIDGQLPRCISSLLFWLTQSTNGQARPTSCTAILTSRSHSALQ